MSGIFFTGPPGRILAAWTEGQLDLLASVDVLTEYRRVARRLAQRCPSIDVDPILDLVVSKSRVVEPIPLPADACDDEDDVMFLACAFVRPGTRGSTW